MLTRAVIALLLLACPTAVLAGPLERETVPSARIAVLSGDTVALGQEKIRLFDVNTPESFRSRCEAELKAGEAARERLAELVASGPVEIVRRLRCNRVAVQPCRSAGPPMPCRPVIRGCQVATDRYGRTLADLFVGGRNIGATLVREGLAVPFTGGRAALEMRLKRWCPGGVEQ